jgi:hypothetical protein
VLHELVQFNIEHIDDGEYGPGTYTFINKRFLHFWEVDGKKFITEWADVDSYFLYEFSEDMKKYYLSTITIRYNYDDEYVYKFDVNDRVIYISFKDIKRNIGSYTKFNEFGVPIENRIYGDNSSYADEAPNLSQVLYYHKVNKIPIQSF